MSELTVVMMDRDPRLVREGFVLAEAARAQGLAAVVLQLDAAMSDEDVVTQVRGMEPRTTAMGVTGATLQRCLGASQALLRAGIEPLLLFGRPMSLEVGRREVPTDAVTAVVVGPPIATVLDFIRSAGRGPIAGLDRLDGDLRPRSPRGTPFEIGGFPGFGDADLVRLRRVGLPIRMGYGCPRRCVYCIDQPREGGFRTRTADSIIEELLHHRRVNNVRRFHFCDLVLNGDLRLLEAVCDLLLERQCVDIQWWGRVMVDPQMTGALYRKMRLAGCLALDLDLPSASDRVLERMGSGFTADEAADALQRASAAGIDTRLSLLVGLPGEAEIEFAETCDWLNHNRFNISQVLQILPCTVEQGSLLWRNHAQYGVNLPTVDPQNDWHDGGFNTRAHRMKRARELRVFVEDQLHLDLATFPVPRTTDAYEPRAPDVPWSAQMRADICARLMRVAERAAVRTGRFRCENLDIAGIVGRGEAQAGPRYLEIDLTNNCNQHCAGCWVHSYLMGENRLTGAKRRATLEYDSLQQLIRDARDLGARRIQLSGAGEPFMHPRIEDVLSLIKGLDIELNVISNFTLVDEERGRKLVDLGVDAVTVSLWAGSAETYVKTHPTASAKTFEDVVRTVSHLTWYRRQTGARYPRVKIYNVISKLNCHEIHKMISLARGMGADLIEFTPIDIVAGKTDSLALSDADSQLILDQLMDLRRRPDYLQRTAEEVEQGRLPGLEEQGEFARFLQQHRLPGDFRFRLEDIRCWETYCRRGIHCSRVYEEIQRDSAIFFGYPPWECRECMASVDCSIDPITLNVRAPYLSLQGFGSFWRRVQGGGAGRDTQIVDRVPCSIGYHYARVQATGHVIPCCKAADFPLGNILEQRFGEVWFSEAYDAFRRKALSSPKSDPYFAPMECYKVCDNLGHNMAQDERVRLLSAQARAALEEKE